MASGAGGISYQCLGLKDEAWVGPVTCVGRITDTVGACVYTIFNSQNPDSHWYIQFFPVAEGTESLFLKYAHYLTLPKNQRFSFHGPLDNILSIACVLEHERATLTGAKSNE